MAQLRNCKEIVKFTNSMTALHPKITTWFERKGWAPREHQLAMLEHGMAGESALLIAPTGGGKTLAGFMATRHE